MSFMGSRCSARHPAQDQRAIEKEKFGEDTGLLSRRNSAAGVGSLSRQNSNNRSKGNLSALVRGMGGGNPGSREVGDTPLVSVPTLQEMTNTALSKDGAGGLAWWQVENPGPFRVVDAGRSLRKSPKGGRAVHFGGGEEGEERGCSGIQITQMFTPTAHGGGGEFFPRRKRIRQRRI